MGSSNQANTSQGQKSQKPKKLSQKEQSERFKQAAREIESDETGATFEAAIGSIMHRKPTKDS